MNAAALKAFRFVPITLALLLVAGLCWFLRAPEPNVLVFTTGSKGGLYHRLALQIKKAVEAEHPDIVIELRNSAGSRQNIKRLDDNEAQIALVQNDAVGGGSVRSIAALYPEVLHLLCRTNSTIRSLRDLHDRRIGIGDVGSGTEQITTNLLAFAGVELKVNNTVRSSFSVALKQLHSGKLDAAFFLSGLGTPSISKALADGQLAFAGIHMQPPTATSNQSPDNIANTFTTGFRVHYPHVSPQTIPLMAYEGWPVEPVPSLGVQAVLVCHKNVEDAVVGRLTRTLFEQRALLSQSEPTFTHLDEHAAQIGLQFPLHDGTEIYFRRQEPGFVAENVDLMGFAITVALLLWSVLIWFRRWYIQRRKNRIDTYYKAVDDVIQRMQEDTDLKGLDELESELLEIRKRAADELVHDRLAGDESFIIYQNMLNGCDAKLLRMKQRPRKSESKTSGSDH